MIVFKTKICGVTTQEDAIMVADSGADALGLNFYEKSKRYVSPASAAEITKHLSSYVKRVGVFVNASSDSIRDTANLVGLDFVQLHGDEPPEMISELATDMEVIRAFRIREGLDPIRNYLDRCEAMPVAVLVDAYDPDAFGGTGKTLHWPELRGAEAILGLRIILAGGLTPNNVAEAIDAARPFGVDTASGVEGTIPGRKDPKLTRAFVEAAKSAFAD